jgi:RNA polymerase sigma factor (sigma-70 family)
LGFSPLLSRRENFCHRVAKKPDPFQGNRENARRRSRKDVARGNEASGEKQIDFSFFCYLFSYGGGSLVEMNESPVHPEISPQALLAEYLRSSRSEASFARLVQQLGGLVYGSAYRRTGDVSLSEEVAQNVFTILFHKAESLQHHTALSSWLYQTTRFESEKALRREARHRRRLEAFTQEHMNDETQSDRISPETLLLLEKSIDRLGNADRELLLARFFEGKKFQEIAYQTKRTEAACKMQLKRVLEKLSGWLSARGCTLSVVALTGLLSSEIARSCPAGLPAKLGVLSQTLSPSGSVLGSCIHLFAAMKISKTLAVAVALLFLAVVSIPVTAHFSTQRGAESQPSLLTMKSPNAAADRMESQRQRDAIASFTKKLGNYPYAYDRLEELYRKYPNLRRKEYQRPDGPVMMEEFGQFIKTTEWELVTLPDEIKDQLKGKKKWNAEEITAFLEKRKDLIAKLIEISKFPTEAPKFEPPQFSTPCPEVMSGMKVSHLLRIASVQALRSNDLQRAAELIKAQRRFRDAIAEGSMVGGMIGNYIESELQNQLSKLSREGYEIAPYLEKPIHSQILAEALRIEFSGLISFMEMLHHSQTPPDVIARALNGFFEPEVPKDYNVSRFTPQPDYRQLGERMAARFSKLIAWMEQSEKSGEWSEPTASNIKKDLFPDISDSTFAGILEDELTTAMINHGSRNPLKSERLYRELSTLDALHRARADGLTPQSLSELVPTYLPKIPVDPMTQQSFSYDPRTRELKLPPVKKK